METISAIIYTLFVLTTIGVLFIVTIGMASLALCLLFGLLYILTGNEVTYSLSDLNFKIFYSIIFKTFKTKK